MPAWCCTDGVDVHVTSVDDYRAEVTTLLGSRPHAARPLADCAGLVLAEDVRAGVALPPFDNSAVDGYALRAADVREPGTASPAELPVVGDLPADATRTPALPPGTTMRIMTGAPMPPGADSVVKVEYTNGGSRRVGIHAPVRRGDNVRRAGEDLMHASIALHRGTVLNPPQLALAASTGRHELLVSTPPRVLLVSTGSELVSAPAPLRPGQIYDANSIMLSTAILALGCEVETIARIADDADTFRQAIEPILPAFDLLVTSGGVSVGAYEVVKEALAPRGVRFKNIAMRPGGPQGCGRWNGVPVIALPGNPTSALVSYEILLRPAMRASMGYRQAERPRRKARLTEALTSPQGRTQFLPGTYSDSGQHSCGRAVAPFAGKTSHWLTSFARANCLITLPEQLTDADRGDEVDILLLYCE
jgi:molybdopterin molybdotransferase